MLPAPVGNRIQDGFSFFNISNYGENVNPKIKNSEKINYSVKRTTKTFLHGFSATVTDKNEVVARENINRR